MSRTDRTTDGEIDRLEGLIELRLGQGAVGPTGPAGNSFMSSPFVGVTAGVSPYTPPAARASFLAVTTSGAQIVIHTPIGPTDGDLLIVTDLSGDSAQNPILIEPSGVGSSIEDPSNPGTFVTPGSFAKITQQGASVWWKFWGATNQWVEIV